jgi:hypothetical protein
VLVVLGAAIAQGIISLESSRVSID